MTQGKITATTLVEARNTRLGVIFVAGDEKEFLTPCSGEICKPWTNP